MGGLEIRYDEPATETHLLLRAIDFPDDVSPSLIYLSPRRCVEWTVSLKIVVENPDVEIPQLTNRMQLIRTPLPHILETSVTNPQDRLITLHRVSHNTPARRSDVRPCARKDERCTLCSFVGRKLVGRMGGSEILFFRS